MKRLKYLFLSLSILLVLSFVIPVPYMQNYAVSEASTVKINKAIITLETGKTTTLKISGTTKSVKWTTSNNKVATVSSKGLVTAKSAGTVNITATVNSKKYTCKVTVKSVLTSEQATKNIQYVTVETNDGLLVILQNDNKIDVTTEVKVVFYDKNGDMLSTDDDYIKTFKAGGQAVMDFIYPYDKNYDKVEYDKFDIIPTVDLKSIWKLKSYVNEVSISSNIGADGIMAKVTNNSNVNLNGIDLTILYYYNNTVVGYNDKFVYDLKSKKNETIEFDIPYDNNYDDILYDNYKIVINEAYTFD